MLKKTIMTKLPEMRRESLQTSKKILYALFFDQIVTQYIFSSDCLQILNTKNTKNKRIHNNKLNTLLEVFRK